MTLPIEQTRQALLVAIDEIGGEALRMLVSGIACTNAGNVDSPFAYMNTSDWDRIVEYLGRAALYNGGRVAANLTLKIKGTNHGGPSESETPKSMGTPITIKGY